MKKLMLAAAATMMLGGTFAVQPAHAFTRCWWSGPIRHCVTRHAGWGYYYHPYRHWGWRYY